MNTSATEPAVVPSSLTGDTSNVILLHAAVAANMSEKMQEINQKVELIVDVPPSAHSHSRKLLIWEEAVLRANKEKDLFLKCMRLLVDKMPNLKRWERAIPSEIMQDWTIDNFINELPRYILEITNKPPTLNEEDLIIKIWESLMDKGDMQARILNIINDCWPMTETVFLTNPPKINIFESHLKERLLLLEKERESRGGFPPRVWREIYFFQDLHKKCFPNEYNESIEDMQNNMGSKARRSARI